MAHEVELKKKGREQMDIVWNGIKSTGGLYEASSTGEIRNAKTGRILHQYDSRHGYKTLMLAGRRNARVHQLVAEAFLGERQERMVVNHKDGNKHNNIPSNLEYVTSSENNMHALQTGLRKKAYTHTTHPFGEQVSSAKITEEIAKDVLRIRKEKGYGARKIAKELGISRGIAGHIIYGRSWKHISRKDI